MICKRFDIINDHFKQLYKADHSACFTSFIFKNVSSQIVIADTLNDSKSVIINVYNHILKDVNM